MIKRDPWNDGRFVLWFIIGGLVGLAIVKIFLI